LPAIFKPLGVKRNALVTFPKYDWAIKRSHPGKYIIIQESKMAAGNAENPKFQCHYAINQCIFHCTLGEIEISESNLIFVRSGYPAKLKIVWYNATGSKKSNMADVQLEKICTTVCRRDTNPTPPFATILLLQNSQVDPL
jgi:hypothetical protein